MSNTNRPKPPLTFREVFPEIPEDQLEEAEARFERYLEIVWRIHQRLERERLEKERQARQDNSEEKGS